ncbi:MAG: single-stranded DNA-binding protein [Candidatus Actinomarina sp.]|nr:single-stranded DNA-binding protein [Candidatus Actinomarina sp.]
MSNQQLPSITGEFGVVQEPDLRWNDSGRPWVKIRGAAKSRKYEKDTNEWTDGESLYIDILLSGKMAEHLTESVTVGDAITVSGRLSYSEWKDKEGGTRHSYQILADYIGVSTRFGPQKSARLDSGMKQSPEQATSNQSEQDPPF